MCMDKAMMTVKQINDLATEIATLTCEEFVDYQYDIMALLCLWRHYQYGDMAILWLWRHYQYGDTEKAYTENILSILRYLSDVY